MIHDIITDPKFPILTGLVGYLIGNYLAIGRDKRDERQRAKAAFRQAIQEEVCYLCPPRRGVEVWSILVDCADRHFAAFVEFRPFVPYFKRRGFEKAWKEYRSICRKHVDVVGVSDEERRSLGVALQRVADYAKP